MFISTDFTCSLQKSLLLFSEDFNEYVEEPIILPQSTNSLLFTEPICSVPFAYACGVFLLSVISLALAMVNNLEDGSAENPFGLPVQVDISVRIAQYVGEQKQHFYNTRCH